MPSPPCTLFVVVVVIADAADDSAESSAEEKRGRVERLMHLERQRLQKGAEVHADVLDADLKEAQALSGYHEAWNEKVMTMSQEELEASHAELKSKERDVDAMYEWWCAKQENPSVECLRRDLRNVYDAHHAALAGFNAARGRGASSDDRKKAKEERKAEQQAVKEQRKALKEQIKATKGSRGFDYDEHATMHDAYCAVEGNANRPTCRDWVETRKAVIESLASRDKAPL